MTNVERLLWLVYRWSPAEVARMPWWAVQLAVEHAGDTLGGP